MCGKCAGKPRRSTSVAVVNRAASTATQWKPTNGAVTGAREAQSPRWRRATPKPDPPGIPAGARRLPRPRGLLDPFVAMTHQTGVDQGRFVARAEHQMRRFDY